MLTSLSQGGYDPLRSGSQDVLGANVDDGDVISQGGNMLRAPAANVNSS